MDERPQLPQVQPSGQNAKAADGHDSDAAALGQAPALHTQSGEPGSDDTGISELDRQYIEKAISAVEDNSGDPYAQIKAINQIRADYLSGRFGKQINNDT